MPGGRRGLVAPQNTFLENIIRRSNQQRKFEILFCFALNTFYVKLFYIYSEFVAAVFSIDATKTAAGSCNLAHFKRLDQRL